jgi:DnaJ-domain-containing protein 1
MNKLKPQINDKERERMLALIATKGVVQLFNAVKEQQQSIKNKLSEMGSSETKRDKVLSQFTKTQFLDKLKTKKQKNNNVINFFNIILIKTLFDLNFNLFLGQ